MRPNLIRRVSMGLIVAVAPAVFAVMGSSPASAGPDVCVTGPYGYASACVEVPGVAWHGPKGWHKGPGKGHGHHHHH